MFKSNLELSLTSDLCENTPLVCIFLDTFQVQVAELHFVLQ